MITPKKRTLNEIRQTKDTYYVVPKFKSKDNSQKLFSEFFGTRNDNINSVNYPEFITFIKEKGYHIVKR